MTRARNEYARIKMCCSMILYSVPTDSWDLNLQPVESQASCSYQLSLFNLLSHLSLLLNYNFFGFYSNNMR